MTTEVSPTRIHAILESLVRERQRLRGRDDAALRKANHMAIAYWQEQLEHSAPRASARGKRPLR